MKIKKSNIIYALSLIVSMFFQLQSPQVLLISALVFAVFLVGNLIVLWVSEGRVTFKFKILFKGLFRDPVVKSMGLFLTGALITACFSFFKTEYMNNKDSTERKELFTKYISECILCDLALEQLEQDEKEPSYAWCDSIGVINEHAVFDLICGYYYLFSTHPDYRKARLYLERASKENPHAAYLYGECLYLGLGDMVKKEEGLPLINSAAEKQVLDAQFRLFGLSITSNNLAEAEKWYGRLIHARSEERIVIYLNNKLLVNRADEGKVRREQVTIENVFRHIFFITFYAHELLYDFQIKGKKPYAAIKLCEDFLSESSWYVTDDKNKLAFFINRLKYTAFVETGNHIQARKLVRNHSLSPFMNDMELNLRIKHNVDFRSKQ